MLNTSRLGKIAVLIPCYNEEVAIGRVISDFQEYLPEATIYVYDNNSKDKTTEVAMRHGAIVRKEKFQGKGNVVRRMFADIEADTYLMVDGDGTYDASHAPAMLAVYEREGVDNVIAIRMADAFAAYRSGHQFGNKIFTSIVGVIFGRQSNDMLSGYRIFSRRFVKSFPALSQGFEIETELTIHAMELRMASAEVPTPYFARPEGSESKLRTYRDGWRILMTIVKIVKQERPLHFFGLISALLTLLSAGLAIPLGVTYFETGLVPRIPTAVLSTGLMLLAFLSLACGFILDTVTRGRQEMKRMQYLTIPGPMEVKQSNLQIGNISYRV